MGKKIVRRTSLALAVASLFVQIAPAMAQEVVSPASSNVLQPAVTPSPSAIISYDTTASGGPGVFTYNAATSTWMGTPAGWTSVGPATFQNGGNQIQFTVPAPVPTPANAGAPTAVYTGGTVAPTGVFGAGATATGNLTSNNGAVVDAATTTNNYDFSAATYSYNGGPATAPAITTTPTPVSSFSGNGTLAGSVTVASATPINLSGGSYTVTFAGPGNNTAGGGGSAGGGTVSGSSSTLDSNGLTFNTIKGTAWANSAGAITVNLAPSTSLTYGPTGIAGTGGVDLNTHGTNAAPVVGSAMLTMSDNIADPNLGGAKIGVWNAGGEVNGISATTTMTTFTGGATSNTTLTLSESGAAYTYNNPASGTSVEMFKVDNLGNGTFAGGLNVGGQTTTNGINNNGAINTTTLNVTGQTNTNGIINTGNIVNSGAISTATLTTTGNASIGGTLNMNGNRIQNVANGVAPGDAVNVSQLQASQSRITGQLQDSQKLLSRGVAATVAMANIPIVDEGKTVSFGVGVGHYNGENGLSIGASYRVMPQAIMRASIASGSGGSSAFGLGMSSSW
jgi:hypothetical protein